MSLRAIDPDPAAVAAARDQLPRLVRSPSLADYAPALVTSTDVALALPHQVYALGVDDLDSSGGIDRARVVAQGFLLMNGQAAVATVEVRGPEYGIQVGGGSFPRVVAAGVERAERQPELDGAEVRLLRVSALHLAVLWLHGPAPGTDRLLPLGRPPEPVEADRFYEVDELLGLLDGTARRLAGDGGDTGG
jgi:hypothetical protein